MYQLIQGPKVTIYSVLFLDLSPHSSAPDTRTPDHCRVLGIDLGEAL